ncbi:UDP-N-acetylmuramoyl-tripeptide--D-alanyl-D-alanine ligase [Spongiactinospora sp. TRM90649]|uniref:UDP-N-acetylmuramoyl-tripeptide--D-alanyl-D- alanine ligase n=1 Tax=Spongiactinospora sp. TRM90649 TaxID=3031114 RepID=UPI0023FA1F9A|nr:UDP-N-acetylmuramoyl-tripeptide--D-alanyl-D-alanine ligase [Spongiactinospora sp. TRM90649]MDF5754559.1 UDP-N-acetylmuramoyl-tripeptide--D-alanyl-D-alanine ligase [Spongiactinospora sp. TRM90649]
MIPVSLREIARVVEGTLYDVPDPEARVVAPAVVDSREVVPGGLFAATAGLRVDGHNYVADAVAAGAVAVLATRPVGVPALVVADVQRALAKLAAYLLERVRPVVIGLTGSVGKTTTKDLLAQVLERHAPTIATDRSFNNEIGLPLTVLRADAATRYLVLEMGASRKGDITYLTGIARPSIGLVLNVGTAHMARMGRGLADVASAKGELVEALPPDGVALLNADDSYVMGMAGRTTAQIVTYGRASSAHVRAERVRMGERARAVFDLVTPSGRAGVRLGVMGEHQVANALAAAAAATVFGLTAPEIAEGLSTARRRSSGRLEVTDRPDGVTVVNDAYNASPESVRAGLRTLKALAGARRTIAVLGAMGQQAAASRTLHEQVGRLAAELGVHVLVAVGPGDPVAMARAAESARLGIEVHTVEDVTGAVRLTGELLEPGDVVLVKASSEVGLDACARALAGT